MDRKKIDNRIRLLIENGVKLGHRTIFALVGDKGRDQVAILHRMLSKVNLNARPSVLWCYKNKLEFSSHSTKRMKDLQYKIKAGKLKMNEEDSFQQFLASTRIRHCHYSETHKILGNTYGMCVLQDFEALTPNLLARTIETVAGGGLILILLPSLTSLKQLYSMNMDAHQNFKTETCQDVVYRFNERFVLSLASCKRCLVLDNEHNALPITFNNLHSINPVDKSELSSENDTELESLRETLRDTQPVGALINCCKTLDQATAVLKFIEAISEKTLRSTVSLTASRGRGKSAALGLSVAAAVAFGYSNIFVTSPSPENLNQFFKFVFKGFDALGYQEDIDYGLIQSTNPEFKEAIVRVNVFKNNRQAIQYIHPTDSRLLEQAELLIIDEAAAIPLAYVKAMLGPYLIFLASTTSGYEGTGRSLSLKLLQQLRIQVVPIGANTNIAAKKDSGAVTGRVLHEVTLEESIRYKNGDDVELWLTKLLCLDATSIAPTISGCPSPDSCELYYINRDTLFSYHEDSEKFLERLMSLYVASHYKNTPNDLQIMSDAPAHHLFCLLGPINSNKSIPDILVVIQVCLEGELSKKSIKKDFLKGKRPASDLIPWTIAQQFLDLDFPKFYGARIVRIATNPDHQGMGYGTRALTLLKDYYEFKMTNIFEEKPIVSKKIDNVSDEDIGLLEESIRPRKGCPPLLLKLHERQPEKLHYIGVSYGLTEPLLKFWKRAGFVPVYIHQTTNDLSGEYSCIMLNALNFDDMNTKTENWLTPYWTEFRKNFISLLAHEFNAFTSSLALSILSNEKYKLDTRRITENEVSTYFTSNDLKRLERYSNNLVDYHLIKDLTSGLAKIYFLNQMDDVTLSPVQSAILLSIGLQYKTMNALETELDLPNTQLLGLFNRLIRKSVQYLNSILEEEVEKSLAPQKDVTMTALAKSMHDELEEAAKELQKKQKKELEKLKKEEFEQFKIKGPEEEWIKVLTTKGKKTIISVKSGEKRMNEFKQEEVKEVHQPKKKKQKKGKT